MPPEAALPIDAAGRLGIRSPGGVDLSLEAHGSTLKVEVGTLGDLLRLRREVPRAAGSRPGLDAAAAASRLTDLECVVRLRRREIVRIGPGTRPNWLSRLLGLAPACIDWRGLLSSLIARDHSS